ncbi:putative MFS toxin efflux pump [Lepidopterella palustris CBS 459.81]|uniref:Putative MFS toxin efflux pump n=1 Tax=Lepidopterella palustris CBS 459.81 TaxID=1314670 RepID=A0A8E2JE02_9PEZI|nr:putative MFS toxin efflux pump [Lepidopterella palustris CBS 459.81]
MAVTVSIPDQDCEKSDSEKPHVPDEPKSTETSSITAIEILKGAEDVGNGLDKAEESEITSTYPTGLKLVTLIIALCLAVFLVALDQTIIATAIPKITDRFNSISDIGWYGSAYFLTSTSLQPTFGRIYKVFNVKIIFLLAIGVFELGSLICAVAPSSTALIVGRAVAGMGVGGIFSGALVIIAHTLPLQKRPMIFGAFGAMWGLASIAGPLLGGVFTEKISWRWCFYINLPVGGFSIAVVLLVLHIHRNPNDSSKSYLDRIKELDLIGASILIPGIICLLLAVQWGGNTYPWNSSRIIGLFVGAGLLLPLFIYSQIRLGDKATLPPRILKQRTVGAAAAFVFFFGAAVFVLMYYLPLYLQSVKDSSPTRSGIQILPFMLSTVLTSILAGVYVTLVGYYTPLIIFSSALMTIGAGLITTFGTDTVFRKWFGYQIITGLGAGVGFNIPLVAVQTVLPMEDIPIGTVSTMFFQSLGGALFIAVGQSVFQNGLIDGLKLYAPELDPKVMVNTGATAIRGVLKQIGREDQLRPVLMAYVHGLKDCYRVVVAAAGIAFLMTCLLEWKSVKKATGKGEMPAIAA